MSDHSNRALASIEPPLPAPLSTQLANQTEEAHRPPVFALAFEYAVDVLEVMVVAAVGGCPADHTPALTLRHVLSDLASVPAIVRGAMLSELARITEFALVHSYGSTQMRDLECALGIAYSAAVAEADDLPAMRAWYAETAWEAANNPVDGLAGRAIREASVDETRVGLASAWSAVLNLIDPAHAICRYRDFLGDPTTAAERAH